MGRRGLLQTTGFPASHGFGRKALGFGALTAAEQGCRGAWSQSHGVLQEASDLTLGTVVRRGAAKGEDGFRRGGCRAGVSGAGASCFPRGVAGDRQALGSGGPLPSRCHRLLLRPRQVVPCVLSGVNQDLHLAARAWLEGVAESASCPGRLVSPLSYLRDPGSICSHPHPLLRPKADWLFLPDLGGPHLLCSLSVTCRVASSGPTASGLSPGPRVELGVNKHPCSGGARA